MDCPRSACTSTPLTTLRMPARSRRRPSWPKGFPGAACLTALPHPHHVRRALGANAVFGENAPRGRHQLLARKDQAFAFRLVEFDADELILHIAQQSHQMLETSHALAVDARDRAAGRIVIASRQPVREEWR